MRLVFESTSLLQVPLHCVSLFDAVTAIVRLSTDHSRQHHIATPNPEMCVHAFFHPAFRSLLQKTTLNLPDGSGLLFASRLTSRPLFERVTGVDTVQAVCSIPHAGPFFFLGAGEGIAEQAAERLRLQFPFVDIAGTYSGSPRREDRDAILQRINASHATILFVAFGSPAQEEWIHEHLASMPSIRVAIGVGGTFDFLSGHVKRAPLWMQEFSLEWLWRLWQEPRRIQRILTAVVVFPLLCLWSALRAGGHLR
jgi:N-acetylglucosaminyldiphosphoundecaprenol N-acetyl-beta-D-mannosaminyltransferase